MNIEFLGLGFHFEFKLRRLRFRFDGNFGAAGKSHVELRRKLLLRVAQRLKRLKAVEPACLAGFTDYARQPYSLPDEEGTLRPIAARTARRPVLPSCRSSGQWFSRITRN